MAAIRQRVFRTPQDLTTAVADLLEDRLTRPFGRPHAVMVSGGTTPLAAYAEMAQRNRLASDDVHVMLADERMVPEASPDSNLGHLRPLLASMEVAEERVLRVRTELRVKQAAADYDRAIQSFLRTGGRITLGLLGLGADGHTASLFSDADLTAGRGVMAIPVKRATGPDRVSVTPDLLKRVEALIFLVVGRDKQEVVSRLLKDPESLVAGQAVSGAASVQLWTA